MTPEEQIELVKRHYALNASGDYAAAEDLLTGDDHAVEVVEFTFAGDDGVTVQNTEVIRFRGQQICEIRPFYHDPAPWIAAAARLKAARNPGASTSSSS